MPINFRRSSPKRNRTSSECSANSTLSTLTPPPRPHSLSVQSSSATATTAATAPPKNSAPTDLHSFNERINSAANEHSDDKDKTGDNYRNGNDLNSDHTIRSSSTSPTHSNNSISSNNLLNSHTSKTTYSEIGEIVSYQHRPSPAQKQGDHHSSAGCSTNKNNISNRIDLLSKKLMAQDPMNINKTFNNNNQEINLNAALEALSQAGNNIGVNHSSVHKRSMDNVLKRLSNKMKSSSLRDEDGSLRRNSKNSSPPTAKSPSR